MQTNFQNQSSPDVDQFLRDLGAELSALSSAISFENRPRSQAFPENPCLQAFIKDVGADLRDASLIVAQKIPARIQTLIVCQFGGGVTTPSGVHVQSGTQAAIAWEKIIAIFGACMMEQLAGGKFDIAALLSCIAGKLIGGMLPGLPGFTFATENRCSG